MAIASTPTLLSLDEFAQIMGLNPWGFNQLDFNQLLGDSLRTCSVFYQHEWQKGKTLSREMIAQSIAGAESMIAEQLGYWPAPRFTVGEEIPYPRPYQADWWNVWHNERWKMKSVRTRWGYIITPGAETRTVLDDDATLTLSDEDGDGIDDTWTTDPITTTVTRAEEIAVYFRDADRVASLDGGGEEVWRIRPVQITLDTTAETVVISGPLYLLVDPVLMSAAVVEAQDPTNAAIYVTGVKVSRRWVDQCSQGVVIFEQTPCASSPCATLEVCACFGERDRKAGVVTPQLSTCSGEDTSTCVTSDYAPDFVRIHYKHGHPLGRGYRMDAVHAQMVARLAVTLLPENSCVECQETQIGHWRELPSARNDSRNLTIEEINNPFGPARGAIWAWQRVLERNARHITGAIR